MARGRRAAALGAAVGVLAASMQLAAPVRAGSIWVPGSEGIVNVPATTISERKFSKVVKQRYDFSCGSAALATLLTFHYDDPTDETATFRYMYDHGDQRRIAQAGFSLLDMKGYLANHGYDSDGYEATLPVLANAGVPAIALINYRGYRHFVIVKGVRNNHVLLGDPALGTRLVAAHEFERMWDNGVLFIVKSKPEIGRRNFNTEAQWQGLAVAPLGAALAPQDLASLTVNLPRFGEF
ncbi:MAG TPA: C39 family peptidase [Gammaproteobacteria bacterium]|nr:C39 family peptidase [Gammaproteobacteria bacterium]